MSNASLAGCSILICEDEPLIAIHIADAFLKYGRARSDGAVTCPSCHSRLALVGRLPP